MLYKTSDLGCSRQKIALPTGVPEGKQNTAMVDRWVLSKAHPWSILYCVCLWNSCFPLPVPQIFSSGSGVHVRLSKHHVAQQLLLAEKFVWRLHGQTRHMQAYLPGLFPAARVGFALGRPVVLDGFGGFFCSKMPFLSKA